MVEMMKKMKVLKTILLSVLIGATLMLCFTACKSKNSAQETKEIKVPTFVVETVSARAGDKDVPVTVSVKNNPGISSIALQIDYDKSQLSLTGFEINESIGGQYAPYNASADPQKLVWINWSENVEGDWVFATLHFDVNKDVKGDCNITVSYDPDDVYNVDEENLDFEIVNGGIKIK